MDGKTSFIIEPGDAESLAEKILWLQEHGDLAKAMGRAGRERIENEFSVEVLVAKTIAVYDEVLRK